MARSLVLAFTQWTFCWRTEENAVFDVDHTGILAATSQKELFWRSQHSYINGPALFENAM
jgi:hypothetical protein